MIRIFHITNQFPYVVRSTIGSPVTLSRKGSGLAAEDLDLKFWDGLQVYYEAFDNHPGPPSTALGF